MKRVIIESPFAGNEFVTREEHERYLDRCILDCLRNGETPYASHRMLTSALDDDDAEERALGLQAGFDMAEGFELVRVYTDYGISKGMAAGIEIHKAAGREVVYCLIGRSRK